MNGGEIEIEREGESARETWLCLSALLFEDARGMYLRSFGMHWHVFVKLWHALRNNNDIV